MTQARADEQRRSQMALSQWKCADRELPDVQPEVGHISGAVTFGHWSGSLCLLVDPHLSAM